MPTVAVGRYESRLEPLVDVSLFGGGVDLSSGYCLLDDDIYPGLTATIVIEGVQDDYAWGSLEGVVCSDSETHSESVAGVKFSARIEPPPEPDPDTGNGSCAGAAPACATHTFDVDCRLADGCTWQPGSCHGAPPACSTQSNGNCWRIPGCVSSTNGDDCTGTPTPCAGLSNDFDCGVAQGCDWTAAVCGGAPAPCASHTSDYACTSDGCVWTP
ncbi:MAG: hypothetical protein U1F43_21995 [Myxococcota bacterium]